MNAAIRAHCFDVTPPANGEGMVADHCARRDHEGWDAHSHSHIPETSWE